MDQWTIIAGTRIIGLRSRFEVDLNRPRQRAVYLEPEDTWGLRVWKVKPAPDIISRSGVEYDAFYVAARQHSTDLERLWLSYEELSDITTEKD